MSIEITVRLFATLRQQAGWSQKTLEVEEGTTLRDLLKELESVEDSVELSGRPVYAAVNKEYADTERVLSAGDEVALFPPVSGGCHRNGR